MLSISIVLYKTPTSHIKSLINSIHLFEGDAYVYFIDNSPSDSLKKACVSKFGYEYIHLPDNPGYGSGHNIAIRKAQSQNKFDFHLVLNADIYFNSDIITPMVKYMSDHPRVGQMMPKILSPDGNIQYLCKLIPYPKDLIMRRLPKFLAKNNNDFEIKRSGYDKIFFAPFLSGCFMLLRHDALKKIGSFDERFFMYSEDIDLTRRIALHYETLFFPYVSAFHLHGAASHKSLKMLIIHAINLVRYFNKWGWFIDSDRLALNKKTLSQF